MLRGESPDSPRSFYSPYPLISYLSRYRFRCIIRYRQRDSSRSR